MGRSGPIIAKTIITYLLNVWNLALGALVIFAVLALLGSWATGNFDVVTILAGSPWLIFATLMLYAIGAAFIVSDYQRELWFYKNHILQLIRLGFTPVMALVLYLF